MTHPFTSTFIAMAESAQEIQAMRPIVSASQNWNPPHPGIGSFFCKPYNEGWEFRVLSWQTAAEQWMIGAFHESDGDYFWVPRLDQLLKMLDRPMGLIRTRWSGIFGDDAADWHEIALTAVMLAKYGKKWTGTEWRKA